MTIDDCISIHALLAESDCGETYSRHKARISIHALLAESDRRGQSVWIQENYFYPRSPCGERPGRIETELCSCTISIHALLAESDSWISSIKKRTPAFLSTLSLRRATDQATNTHRERQISIHALLAESDNINSSVTTADKISIHALLAESDRPQPPQGKSSNKFLSTLSLRRATHYDNYNLHCVEISIHALLAESDPD